MRCFVRALILLLALGQAAAPAAQVSWGSAAQSRDLDSAGLLFQSGYIFELGAFIPGFTPTAANTEDWASNWVSAARVAYDVTNRAFSGPRYVYSANATPFLPTNRGWIWGYRLGRPDEWILIGNPSWLWPDASSPFALPVIWDVPSATQTVVGTLNMDGAQMRSAPVTNAAVPELSFTDWRRLFFNTAEQNANGTSGVEADPDGDGIANILEYLTGTTPRQPNALPITFLGLTGVEVLFPSSRAASVTAEVSNNLLTWQRNGAVQATRIGQVIRFAPAVPQDFPNQVFWRFKGSLR